MATRRTIVVKRFPSEPIWTKNFSNDHRGAAAILSHALKNKLVFIGGNKCFLLKDGEWVKTTSPNILMTVQDTLISELRKYLDFLNAFDKRETERITKKYQDTIDKIKSELEKLEDYCDFARKPVLRSLMAHQGPTPEEREEYNAIIDRKEKRVELQTELDDVLKAQRSEYSIEANRWIYMTVLDMMKKARSVYFCRAVTQLIRESLMDQSFSP